MTDDGFLSRWSRRKAQARAAGAASEPADATPRSEQPSVPVASAADRGAAETAETAEAVGPTCPTSAPPSQTACDLPDLASLTHADDFVPFMRAGVDAATRNAALRTLFADPHFNVMDGLDTYIDDYSKPAPMAPAMVRRLRAARLLGLADDEPGSPASDASEHAPSRLPTAEHVAQASDEVLSGERLDEAADGAAACGPPGTNTECNAPRSTPARDAAGVTRRPDAPIPGGQGAADSVCDGVSDLMDIPDDFEGCDDTGITYDRRGPRALPPHDA